MKTAQKSLHEPRQFLADPETMARMTAADLMVSDPVVLARDLPLREAAWLLIQHLVGGAPVVDEQGRCVGVFSAADCLRLAAKGDDILRTPPAERPVTCTYQVKEEASASAILCTQAPGACPVQDKQRGKTVCSQPHTVLADWQVVAVERPPVDAVEQFMTQNPTVAAADVPIRELARMMIDAQIHRVVVVDGERRPLGVVSSIDVLAAVAFAEAGPRRTSRGED